MGNSTSLIVLKSQGDFLRLKERGFRYRAAPWLLLNWAASSEDDRHLRCGWTISKKVGSAVTRNRFKRWCRYYFQNNPAFAKLPVDVNVVFLESGRGKEFFKKIRYDEFKANLDRFFEYLVKSRKVPNLVGS